MVLTASRYDVLQRGAKASDFKLKGIDGKTYSLANFTGKKASANGTGFPKAFCGSKKALLVIFMCNHCPYVQPKVTKMVELFTKYAPKGLAMIGINSNDVANYPDDSFESMKKFAAERGIKFAYVIDETQKVAKAYGAACTPDPFLFNEKFELVYHGRIDDAHGKPHIEAKTNELEEAVQQVLKNGNSNVQALPSMGCNVKWKV